MKQTKQNKGFFASIKNFFVKLASSDKDENPFTRMIKRIGYASLGSGRSADEFHAPSFDLEEVISAFNTESYVRQALDKYIELMFKAGWKAHFQNPKVKEYMNKRFMLLADAMGEPIDDLWRGISEDLVKYSNCFIVKKRVAPEKMPTVKGLTYKGLGGKKPVGAYFRLPAETMEIKVDKFGTVKKYKQVTTDEEVEFKPEDIVHITYKKPAGKMFGYPFLLPVIDDIKLLRQVEDNVARLLYRFLYPLFVYKVGLAEAGYESTNEEITDMRNEISNMPIDGGLVIPERHDIDIMDTDGSIDASGYLEYFENRVFTGLGVSKTIMGRADTSNRSTAENQSSEMRDKVKSFQKVVQDYVNHFIIRELLLEGGFDPLLNPQDAFRFEFEEIDTDLQIKQENHSIYKFEHDVYTHEEMREELGLEPVKDEGRLRSNMFNQADTTSVDNKNEPQNQHTQSKNIDNILSYRISNLYGELKTYLRNLKENDFLEQAEKRIENFQTRTFLYTDIYLDKSYEKGMAEGLAVPKDKRFKSKEEVKATFKKDFINLMADLSNLMETKPYEKVDILLNLYEEKVNNLIISSLDKAYNVGQLETYKENEHLQVDYTLTESDTHRTINLDHSNYIEMIPQDGIKIKTPQSLKERGEDSNA